MSLFSLLFLMVLQSVPTNLCHRKRPVMFWQNDERDYIDAKRAIGNGGI